MPGVWVSHTLLPTVNVHLAAALDITHSEVTYLLPQYADPVADLLDKWGAFRARLFRESCVFHRGNYVKDLSRLGRDLRRVLILDNSPASYVFHPDNAVSARETETTAHVWWPPQPYVGC